MGYIESARGVFASYKLLGEKAMAQVSDKDLTWAANSDTNSIAVIVKHLYGNMLSRWTDFLTSDGEKPWRQRDAEFENLEVSRAYLMEKWEEGWKCVFDALDALHPDELHRTVYIRAEAHTAMDAINRQIAHYSSHIGQIIFIAKMTAASDWQSLSIPKGKSAEYNREKFSGEGK